METKEEEIDPPIEVLCLSDVHFGAVSIKSIEALLTTLEERPSINVILFAGDITQDSLAEEFNLASTFFDELIARNKIVIATPGNHDFGGKLAEMASRLPGIKSFSTGYPEARRYLSAMFEGSIFPQSCVLAYREYDSITRVGNEIFVALRTHHRACARVKPAQMKWAKQFLREVRQQEGEEGWQRLRLHLVCHHALWQDSKIDKHKTIEKQRRLEKKLLKAFGFSTFIHGHNHRFSYQNTTTPEISYRIRRISVPTLSDRNKKWERGFLIWRLITPDSQEEPQLVNLSDEPEEKEENEANQNEVIRALLNRLKKEREEGKEKEREN